MAAGYDGQSLTFLAPGPVFVKVNFSVDLQGSVPGRFKLITFPVHFIPILTTLAPSEHQALDPRGWGSPFQDVVGKNSGELNCRFCRGGL